MCLPHLQTVVLGEKNYRICGRCSLKLYRLTADIKIKSSVQQRVRSRSSLGIKSTDFWWKHILWNRLALWIHLIINVIKIDDCCIVCTVSAVHTGNSMDPFNWSAVALLYQIPQNTVRRDFLCFHCKQSAWLLPMGLFFCSLWPF